MRENLYQPNCIRTFLGHYINPLSPEKEKISINDIAHALSMIPRFGGHLPEFYSVAEHSINVMRLIEKETDDEKMILCGLMHDATEAYLLDLPKPIKNQIPEYVEAEKKLWGVIADKFNLPKQIPDLIKRADKIMLQMEWERLMLNQPKKETDWMINNRIIDPNGVANEFRHSFFIYSEES